MRLYTHTHTHTHTSALKNRKSTDKNIGRNGNIDKNSDKKEKIDNSRVYINKKNISSCYNSNNYNEQNNITKKRKVIKIRIVFLMALLVVIIGIFANTEFFQSNIQNSKYNIFSRLGTSQMKDENNEKEKNIEEQKNKGNSIKVAELQESKAVNVENLGQYAIITSAAVTGRQTGTAPWDGNNEPGNDTDADNNVVRTFDTIKWTIENNIGLKEGAPESSYIGGKIEIKAQLPANCGNKVKWQTDEMVWAKNVEISQDKTSFKAEYEMPIESITAPGKQSVELVLKIYGAENGLEIVPTFTISIVGNNTNEAVTANLGEWNDAVKISAVGKYNIVLKNNDNLTDKTTVDYGEGNQEGRMNGYGFAIELYNEAQSKGLKGVEYPKGDITFDIDLKLERSKEESSELEDITDLATPILWNYRVNNWSDNLNGNITNRKMYNSGTVYSYYHSFLPLGIKKENRTYSVNNSGNIEIKQEIGKLKVTISNYDIDGIFPECNAEWNNDHIRQLAYTENRGIFSVGYMQIFVPDTDADTIEDRQYYLTVQSTNMKIKSMSNNVVENQMNKDDDMIQKRHYIIRPGYYQQSINIEGGSNGDSAKMPNEKFEIYTKLGITLSNDYDIKSASKFIKFDGEGIEPILYDDGSRYKKEGFAGNMEFKVWYVTKKDGTNWSSQEEMNNTNVEELDLYEKIEQIPKNKICVGEFLESTGGVLAKVTGDNNIIYIRVKIKENAKIGKTYGITHRTKYWLEELDRNVYTVTKGNITYPKIEWDSGNLQYIKSEYNEDGSLKNGTHNGGNGNGTSVLVVGAELSLSKKIKNKDASGSTKTIYDIGKNEYDVIYGLQPSITKNPYNNESITGVHLRIEDILPKEMEYKAGSTKLGESTYTEPTITPNADGTTKLTWELYNCSTEVSVKELTYTAHINEETANNKKCTNTATVREIVGTGEEYKIGTTPLTNTKRVSSQELQVVNLGSYTLYKTTETPVIEKNGEVHYKITAINKTDTAMPEFQLLDILPYNNDGRGTAYHGSYTVSRIEITETNTTTGQAATSNIKLYITEKAEVRDGVTAKDDNLGTDTSMWQAETASALGGGSGGVSGGGSSVGGTSSTGASTYQIGKAITACAIVGEMEARERIEIEIYLQTSNNQPGDTYGNTVTAQTSKATEAMGTPSIWTSGVKRKLTGKVWLDGNKNGIIDDDITSTNTQGSKDRKLRGIKVMLQKEDGSNAQDINGDDIQPTITNEQGEYTFENMQRGKYKVAIDITGIGEDYKYYEITAKGVGSNEDVNSKINPDNATNILTQGATINGTTAANINTIANIGNTITTDNTIYTTDVIDKLDNIDAPEIVANNINAGITYKDTSVKITKLWQGDGANSATGNVEALQAGNSQNSSLDGVSQASRPSEITVNLLQDGELAQNVQISASGSWTKTVEQLPCYDVVLQKKIEYTVQEQVSMGYYTTVARIDTTQGNEIIETNNIKINEVQKNANLKEEQGINNIAQISNEQEIIETYEYEITNSKYGSITLTKVDSQNKSKTLTGAKFKIEKEGDASFAEQTQETTSTGQVAFANLKYGKYKITELQAPSGYNLLTQPIEVEITAAKPDYVATISNNAQTNLPQTGGMNKLIIIIDGILLLMVVMQYRKLKY